MYEKEQNLDIADVYQQQIGDFLAKVLKTRDQIINSAKKSSFVNQVDNLNNKLLSNIENQLQNLNGVYQFESPENQKIQQNALRRFIKIIFSINNLAKIIILEKIKKIQNLEAVLKIKKIFYRIINIPKIREFFIFVEITHEFFYNFALNEVFKPSISYISEKYTQLSQKTLITVENVQQKIFKKYLPYFLEKFQILKKATINFYQNTVTITFAQEFIQLHSYKIEKEIKQILQNLQVFQEKTRKKYTEVYQNALESYRKKREVKVSEIQQKIKELNQRESEKILIIDQTCTAK